MRKILTKRLAAVLTLIGMLPLLTTGCSSSDPEGSGPPEIKIMVGGMEKIIYLPAKLTENLGYFKQEGLDVELINQGSGQSAEEALVAGQVDAVVGFYDHTIDLQSKGKYLKSVIQLGITPGETLMVDNKDKDRIKGVRDLKGKKIGVTGLGASTNFLANYLVVKGGYTSKDYIPVPVGAGNTLIASMQQGRIGLAVTTEPTVSLLQAKHLAVPLVDMSTPGGTRQAIGGDYPAACLYLRSDYIKSHPETVQKLVNAFSKTLNYMQTHKPEEIASRLPKAYYAGDKQMYVSALSRSMSMFSPDGKMPEDGPAKVYEVLSAFKPKLKQAHVKLEETYTNEFVEKANQAGQ
ncbi:MULTISPECIES: ABC transporter substrate-binding protein [Thermoactinomyces]|uniref:ABC transporter substrate-binding protein n=1 Tax=Thermoactinomyces daqus TaxID=1329516 RepID=A0A7W1XCL9_9BACL|nr:ABC transporter substrate-binding protein [Thermoactinomyces daqus]MBA4544221.1 ABC transporter substrate-binding protein [Thermoactinomyces daqus]MBH8608849.1 ABC transporter substrate-binding protein [Thermoactinomyces sp. CICC 10521]